ncbi:hypothetical protein L202_02618 [Cryptococcus amylolentus CBS 6039]|uniref:GTP-binding protein YPTC4 n=2 Tax=Cryptococcus amylolentus TaxID=104669 RepID=A0A1E3HVM2_9TREE|nr:hypothetical protein L202_02618 [Cryptococcus amylolentus CBS 6039]ODN80357.1 hypothetical protein L202_02618 [Cryptococcus amylolentus CBS 6039]ODO09000.1 hypothetical protein I350_02594 [Cryptococcus amylolentus CBS 6273]
MDLQWDYILKYVLIGDSSVGKSSLLIRLTDDSFNATEPTLGVEFGSKILHIPDPSPLPDVSPSGGGGSGSGSGSRGRGERAGKRVKIQCWDTAGTESFRSITRSYFRGAAGGLVVYDVTRRETFEHATSWLSDLRAHADENVAIILVANKTDLCSHSPPTLTPFGQALPPSSSDPSSSTPPSSSQTKLKPRAVSTSEGQLFARQNGLLYVETSAKNGWGVEEAFEMTAREILGRVGREEAERKMKGRKGINLGQGGGGKGGCC